jgi:hypothetical protein
MEYSVLYITENFLASLYDGLIGQTGGERKPELCFAFFSDKGHFKYNNSIIIGSCISNNVKASKDNNI